ncbi:MAG: SAM-dependent methyltransferase [Propionibacteriales bacterium]|nr:SAM-dependent methyltransferase [Propionibacteriales bacterium]
MTPRADWQAWHAPYADPHSALSRRLRIVQGRVGEWLDANPGPVTVASACAGDGRDLVEVLAGRPDGHRVRAILIESDPGLAERAAGSARAAGLTGLTVRTADAGDPASYAGAVPAHLLLLCGVFGNITDEDVSATIAVLPQLCHAYGTVIWTRSRRSPDLTPRLRRWFAASGFAEQSFDAPDDVLFSVGVHQLATDPEPLTATGRFFTFLT